MEPLIAPSADSSFDLGANMPSLEYLVRSHERYGDVYQVYGPSRNSHTYVIHHPADIRRVLVLNHRNYEKGSELDRVRILLGNGLMTSEGDVWRRRRSMIQPFFQRNVVSAFAGILAETNDQFITRLEEAIARHELVNVTAETSELALRAVLQVLFGRDTARLAPQFSQLLNDPVRDGRFAYRFRSLAPSVREVIRERRAQPQVPCTDQLSMLLTARDRHSGELMSEPELIDEIMTLIVAGHETTASSLNIAWFMLSRHQRIEAQLHAEIDRILPQTPATLEQLSCLTYTRRFINEVLRLYPPGWLLFRRTIEADLLGDYEVPADTDVLIPLFLVHRDARFWKHPESFDPDRFSLEQQSGRADGSYLPFAAGPRHCIGEYMAICEMLMHIATVARRYRLRCATPNLELHAEINLRTLRPIFMEVKHRQ